MPYYGYAGSILHVDLTKGTIRKESLPLDVAGRFLGGFGVNCWLAYELIKPGIDPLSPQNAIILGAGPLVGTNAPGTSRCICTTKFPLSGIVGSASGSMSFGSKLKYAGYDHLVVTGKAKQPVYLKVFDDGIEIRDAGHLWGKEGCGLLTPDAGRSSAGCA